MNAANHRPIMDVQDNQQELQSFLPEEESTMKDLPQNKRNGSKLQEKSESVQLNGIADCFDPFLDRNLDHPTTDAETLIHLLKASLGTGILAMPQAFLFAGLISGIFATVFVSIVCTYCSYLLVKCAHALYARTKVSSMSYADVAEVAFASGPPWSRRFSAVTRQLVLGFLFVTYFGTCSVYTVIIANNFRQVVSHYYAGGGGGAGSADVRLYVAALLVPLVLLSYVPNLKYLAPVSMVANGLMAAGLGITFYYLLFDGRLPAVDERPPVAVNVLDTFPSFFCITVFAMEAIGVVMPLENSMKTPRHFLGIFGVLNVGMGGVTVIYILLGFFGYLKYGDATKDSITLNLPTGDVLAQVAKVCISLAVFCTYGLQFFVCLEIAWNKLQDSFKNVTTWHNYFLRTILVVLSVVLAIAVPTIGPFISLIGALCFSLLGIIAPVLIEFATFWDDVTVMMTVRNVGLIIVGIMALVFGTSNSVEDILKAYAPVVMANGTAAVVAS